MLTERGLLAGRMFFLLFGLNTKCIVLLNALTLIEAICPKNSPPKNEKVLFRSHVRLCFNSLATQNLIVK